jgi:O-antigen/teichoic acid export membrane protein
VGIIKKQTLLGSVINYFGVVIGFVTAAILSPRVNSEYIGLVSVIVSFSAILGQFGGLGLSGIITRMFTYFRTDDNKNHGFLFLALSIAASGFLLSVIITVIIKFTVYAHRPENDLFMQYYWYELPVTFFLIFFSLFDHYYKVLFNAVKGILYRELFQKVGTFTALLLLVSGIINTGSFVIIYIIGFSLPGIIILADALRDKKNYFKPEPGFLTPGLKRSITSVGFFSIISGASGLVAMNVDKLMIEAYSGLSDTGIYTIAFYFGVIISIPARSMIKISSALIAESWNKNDIEKINTIYSKTALSLFVIGPLLVVGLYINLDNIVVLLKGDYAEGKYVIIFIALAYLSDMATGASGQVLFTSKKYKYLSYLMMVYVILIVITNWILIPKYGINGAAVATMLSKIIYNILKYFIIRKSFGLNPYNYKYLLIIPVVFITILINNYIPKQDNFIIDIIIRSSAAGAVYLTLIYLFRIVDIKDVLLKKR